MIYDPPLSLDKIKELYPDKIYQKLKNDPVHRWRAETGIELIHREPDFDEQIRIWKNWNLMNDKQKKISDEKSLELFGITNVEHHRKIMDEVYPNRKFDVVYERIMSDLGKVMLLAGPENFNETYFDNPYSFKHILREDDFDKIFMQFKSFVVSEDTHKEFSFGNKVIGYLKSRIYNFINDIDTNRLKQLVSKNWIHYDEFINKNLTPLYVFKTSFSKTEHMISYIMRFIGDRIDSSYHELLRNNMRNAKNTSGFCFPLGFCYLLVFNSDIDIYDETIIHEFCHYVDLELENDFSNLKNEIISINENDDYFKYLELDPMYISYIKNEHEFYVNIYFNLFKNLQKIFWLNKYENWKSFIDIIETDIENNDFYKSNILFLWMKCNCNNVFMLKILFAICKSNKKLFLDIIENLKNEK